MIYSLTIDLHALYRDAFSLGRRTIGYRDVAAARADDASVTLTFVLRDCVAIESPLAPLWSIADVLQVRPDLTLDQAEDVLYRVADKHDPDLGITRETFRIVADDLFPVALSAGGRP